MQVFSTCAIETVADPIFREAVKEGDVAGAAILDHTPLVGDGRGFKEHVKEGHYGEITKERLQDIIKNLSE